MTPDFPLPKARPDEPRGRRQLRELGHRFRDHVFEYVEKGGTSYSSIAIGAEEQILKVFEEMKPGRAMKTNVEFYAAAVLQGVGLVPDLFPATFALARIAGWSAHAIEQAGVDKLIRPDAKYIGHAERHLP